MFETVKGKGPISLPKGKELGKKLAGLAAKGLETLTADWKGLLGSLSRFLPQTGALYQTLIARLTRRESLLRLGGSLLLMTLCSGVLAIFCSAKEGGLDLYMTTFLPILAVVGCLMALSEALRGSAACSMAVSLLILVGSALQVLLLLGTETAQSEASSLIFHNAFSLLIALGALPVLVWLVSELPGSLAVRLLNGAMILCYLLLLVLGRTVNSTRAWIMLGSFSFQMTEVTKVLAIAAIALTLTDPERNGARRLRGALVTLMINAAFLLVVNELGTLIVIGCVFLVLAVIYLPDLKGLLAALAVMLVLACGVLLACKLCYDTVNPPAAQQSDEQAQERALAQAAEAAGLPAEETEYPALIRQGAKIYGKISLRLRLVLDPDSVDANAGGYQAAKARDAILLSSWLGSEYEVKIPVVESDYVFAYVLMKMGMVFGILVLLALLVMLRDALIRCLSRPEAAEGALGAAFVLCVVIQSLLSAASAAGVIPTIGMPFAFLAKGGSNSVMNYSMTLFILYATRSPRVSLAAPQLKTAPKEERRGPVCRRNPAL